MSASITPALYASLARVADDIGDGLTPARAAIRLRALVDALQLGHDPFLNLMAIAAIALRASTDLVDDVAEPQPAAGRH